jgi:hypothetical protein
VAAWLAPAQGDKDGRRHVGAVKWNTMKRRCCQQPMGGDGGWVRTPGQGIVGFALSVLA